MELFEELRREYEFGVGSIAGVARKFGVHRRLVREALGCAIPQERLSKGRPRPKTGAVAGFIDGILEADRRAPRKQRHTAHRIWVRLSKERPEVHIAEATVRQYVRERKRAMGLRTSPEVYIPQQYAWGEEGQVDWYEAEADWMANGRPYRSLRCARWPAARRFIAPIRGRPSRCFLKRASSGSSTWAVMSVIGVKRHPPFRLRDGQGARQRYVGVRPGLLPQRRRVAG